ncbi:hypothetical protein WJX74_007267 [Apatococcus lobatus]|uniref:Structure-specific endonuclease subunit SLX1 homolog n=1 Tax=Apatococcus lobatus TaxID=904363 RepID=A0AAW1QJ80_9CHLO
MREFFGCYLLVSRATKSTARTYIGFTVNPRRRIRQHNGEITSGAHKTKRSRPWEMVLVLYGFPTKVQALQFEWAWQHPEKSLKTREVAARLGKRRMMGLKGKVILLMEMLNLEPWKFFPLTLQFLSTAHEPLRKGLPVPPQHMRIDFAPMEALPKDVVDEAADDDDDGASSSGSEGETGLEPAAAAASMDTNDLPLVALDLNEEPEDTGEAAVIGRRRKKAPPPECSLCKQPADRVWLLCTCGCRTHPECLARHFLGAQQGPQPAAQSGLPTGGTCPRCGKGYSWQEALGLQQSVGWTQSRQRKKRASPKKTKSRESPAKATSQPLVTTERAGPDPLANGDAPTASPPAVKRRGRPKKADMPAVSQQLRPSGASDANPAAGQSSVGHGELLKQGRAAAAASKKASPAKRKARAASPGGWKVQDKLDKASKPPAKRASPSKKASLSKLKHNSEHPVASCSGHVTSEGHPQVPASGPLCFSREARQAGTTEGSTQPPGPEPLLARLQRLAAPRAASACTAGPSRTFPAAAEAAPACIADVWDTPAAAADTTMVGSCCHTFSGPVPASGPSNAQWQSHSAGDSLTNCQDALHPKGKRSSPANGHLNQLTRCDQDLGAHVRVAQQSSPLHNKAHQSCNGSQGPSMAIDLELDRASCSTLSRQPYPSGSNGDSDHGLGRFLIRVGPSTPLQPSSPGIILIEDTPLPPTRFDLSPLTSAAVLAPINHQVHTVSRDPFHMSGPSQAGPGPGVGANLSAVPSNQATDIGSQQPSEWLVSAQQGGAPSSGCSSGDQEAFTQAAQDQHVGMCSDAADVGAGSSQAVKRPVRVARRLPGCLGAARSHNADCLHPASKIPFAVCKAASHQVDPAAAKQHMAPTSSARVHKPADRQACMGSDTSSAAAFSSSTDSSMHASSAIPPAIQQLLPGQQRAVPVATVQFRCTPQLAGFDAMEANEPTGAESQVGAVDIGAARPEVPEHSPAHQHGISCSKECSLVMGHWERTQKAPEHMSVPCSPQARHSSADDAMPQTQHSCDPGHVVSPRRSLAAALSPARAGARAACSCDDHGCIDGDAPCLSPMVQPSPAPLRQRLGMDACAFQPCKRMELPVASAISRYPVHLIHEDGVEIIEVD